MFFFIPYQIKFFFFSFFFQFFFFLFFLLFLILSVFFHSFSFPLPKFLIVILYCYPFNIRALQIKMRTVTRWPLVLLQCDTSGSSIHVWCQKIQMKGPAKQSERFVADNNGDAHYHLLVIHA